MARCFTLFEAGDLVLKACPQGTDIDSTLEEAGFITDGERKNFVEEIASQVVARNCSIRAADIPGDAATTVRQVRQAVFENAVKKEVVTGGGD